MSHERAAPMIVTETTSRALEVRRARRPLEARESIKPSRFCSLECKAAQIKHESAGRAPTAPMPARSARCSEPEANGQEV